MSEVRGETRDKRQSYHLVVTEESRADSVEQHSGLGGNQNQFAQKIGDGGVVCE